jgi:hypothetical protein
MRKDWFNPEAVSRQVSRQEHRAFKKGRRIVAPYQWRVSRYYGKGANETGRWAGKSLS